jgi:thiol-disulfide isomerase/thioredoxin
LFEKKENGLQIERNLPFLQLEDSNFMNIELNSLPGQKVLIFISLHCTYCIDLLPHLRELSENYNSYNFVLLSAGEVEDHREMINYFDWKFPVVHFDLNKMETFFQVTAMPFMIFADSEGKVFNKGIVYNSNEFENLLRKKYSCSK